MARKKFNVVTIAAMIAILAIGAMGVGYAYWTDSLNINATASTGTLDVEWGALNATDSENMANGGALCDVFVDPNNADSVVVTSTNMYPGYWCQVTGTVTNVGSLPVKMTASAPSFGGSAALRAALEGGVVGGDCSVPATIEPGASKSCTVKVWLDESVDNSDNLEGLTATLTQTLNFEQTIQNTIP